MKLKFSFCHSVSHTKWNSQIGVVLCAVVIDFFVCFAVRGLDLYAEEPEEDLNNGHVASANNKELQPMISSRPTATNHLNGKGYNNTLEA